MTNFQEQLNTEWVEAINLLESIKFDCSDLKTVDDLEEVFSELLIVEDGVWNEDVEIYFSDVEGGKEYLREYHVDVNMADTEDEKEELIDEFCFESCGPYIENLNNYSQNPIEYGDVRTLNTFMIWVQNWKEKENLANELAENLQAKIEQKIQLKNKI